MRIIDADKITFHEIDEVGGEYEPYLGCSKEHIDNQPTVKAIPIERLEQIREEIESNKNTTSMLDCAKFYNNGLDKALEILENLIAENEPQKMRVEK